MHPRPPEYPALALDAAMATALRPFPPVNPADTPPASPDDYLLLQIVINDAEMEDVTEALRRQGKLYLPLGQISDTRPTRMRMVGMAV